MEDSAIVRSHEVHATRNKLLCMKRNKVDNPVYVCDIIVFCFVEEPLLGGNCVMEYGWDQYKGDDERDIVTATCSSIVRRACF